MASVCDLFPGSIVSEMVLPTRPGWSAFNPSIAFSPTLGYAAIIRSSNYTMDALGRYQIADPDGVVRTRNYLATLDSYLDIVGFDEIDDSAVSKPTDFPVRGIEDARLFWENGWYYIGTSREHIASGICTPAVDQLTGHSVTNRCIWAVDSHAKNVVPVVDTTGWTGDYIWQPEPFLLVSTGDQMPSTDGCYFRGSTQGVVLGCAIITVIHEVTWENGIRYYWHRFLRYSKGTTRMSDKFHFVKPGIEFAAGLVVHGDDFVVTFGHRDARAMRARIPMAKVLAALGA